jgi:hypothetical protein
VIVQLHYIDGLGFRVLGLGFRVLEFLTGGVIVQLHYIDGAINSSIARSKTAKTGQDRAIETGVHIGRLQYKMLGTTRYKCWVPYGTNILTDSRAR